MKSNPLVPELSCIDFQKSLDFYTKILGFKIEYERPEKQFAFLSFQGSQLMLEQQNDNWKTGETEYPYGRGINFQIKVDAVDPIIKLLQENNYPLFEEPDENWYRKEGKEVGHKEFLVQDPSGYLLRFAMSLGERSIDV